MAEPVIVALTPNGLTLGRRLVQALGHGEARLARGEARQTLEELFRAGRPIVAVMALGMVGAILGPLARDKFHAPPVAGMPPVFYRPPSLVLGVGCKRGVPGGEIEALFREVFQAQGLSPLSLGVVATVSLKADEPGLREFAARHGIPLRSFSVEEL